ncbi:alpha/beta hydrolase [Amycolatopsis taiwanensis]|uniref:Alpha/beta hydrolase n=1 Tax=Amycolatopsis taiwanensis TaxID=342230 RepID=A0A9W6R463_9PSEU|nr:alpha/beta hydrolase [Amycolatopsis taiwanensis]GLY67257.1 alpha/beta hydrolase [Amycolatopsis taiwanensis]
MKVLLAACTAALIATSGTATATAQPLVPAADRDVRFVADGTITYGTVHVPAHRPGTRLPAALLIPGSGPTDRDGNEPGLAPATLRLIAETLGDDGVMTLRFDKYGTGKTGLGRYQDDPSRLDMESFTRQAGVAYATLRAQPEADSRAMLIVGHSEGGLQALLVARQEHPAAIALLAPQDLRLLDLLKLQISEQIDAALAAGALTAAEAEANKSGLTRVIAQFRDGAQPDYTGMTADLVTFLQQAIFSSVNARFVRSDDAIYPPDVARTVHTRAMVTCGTADTQVPCWTTAPLLAALPTPEPRVLPGIDHFLHTAGTPAGEQVLAPAVRQALREFWP